MELRQRLSIESNLLAHHLDVLEGVGAIERSRSSGDGRRRYVHLRPNVLNELRPGDAITPRRALFICTANSARSQLAAALWRSHTGRPANSAGTDPAARVHPGAVAAASRAGLDLHPTTTSALRPSLTRRDLVITVCDQAHETLHPGPDWLHWSVLDPVPDGTAKAFDHTILELRHRIEALVTASGSAA